MSLSPPPEPPTKRSVGDNATAITISAIRFFTTLVDRFGWPGAALFALGMAIQLWATPEQKQEMVAMYILGKGMLSWWPLAVPSAVFLLLAWAQHEMKQKEIKEIKQEMRRIGKAKSEAQEKASKRKLRHRRSNADD